MPNTVLAAATGLPNSRRSFLSGLATLPLVGGSVALIGKPTAAAVPVTHDLMHSYKNWLFMEHRMACHELAGHDVEMARGIEQETWFTGLPGDDWHFQWSREAMRGPAGWIDAPQPSTRAAIVLSAVGVPVATERSSAPSTIVRALRGMRKGGVL